MLLDRYNYVTINGGLNVTKSTGLGICRSSEFACDDRCSGNGCNEVEKCIPESERCDGNDDCGDNSDEYQCSM